MIANSTKYPNNQRIVSGTVDIKKDDVTLLCDTSTAPVIINLLAIPSSNNTYGGRGNWNTLYKVYVVDYAQNSNSHNITVVAPAGFKINGASSQVINTNGAALIVRIVSNIDYLGISGSGVGTAIPYVLAVKSLKTLATVFFPINANRTLRLGATATVYDTKIETGIMAGAFNLATGIFTVPADGVYNLNAEIACQINNNPNLPQDGALAYWMTGAADVGQFTAGIVRIDQETIVFLLTANNKAITQNTSDILISASAMNIPLTKGQILEVKILNTTNHDVVGVNDTQNAIVFSAHKIA